jgi:hypothetical protein
LVDMKVKHILRDKPQNANIYIYISIRHDSFF